MDTPPYTPGIARKHWNGENFEEDFCEDSWEDSEGLVENTWMPSPASLQAISNPSLLTHMASARKSESVWGKNNERKKRERNRGLRT